MCVVSRATFRGQNWKAAPSLVLAVAPDDMEQRDVVEHLVPVVPGEEGSLPGVVIHHTDVGILVVEGNVSVLVCGGVGVVGKVDLGSGQVRVGDVEGAADHEGLPCAALGKARVPALQDLQGARVQTAHLESRGELFNRLSGGKKPTDRRASSRNSFSPLGLMFYMRVLPPQMKQPEVKKKQNEPNAEP